MPRLALLLTAASLAAEQPPPSLEIRPLADDPTQVEVVAQGKKGRLSLVLLDEEGRDGPSILGNVRQRGERMAFIPKYGLGRGLRYRATLLGPNGSRDTAIYSVPNLLGSEPAVVKQVYPSASTLPANNLKFYLHFSKPMREGKAIFDQIQILDMDNGNEPIPHPWRRVELWSHEATRLTLWIHPGRIKQGVNLREDEGPVLHPNHRYVLLVSRKVRNAEGQPLDHSYRKEFVTSNPDRERPLPSKWRISNPGAGTLEPLRIRFPESLDHSLLHRMLTILDDQAKPVAGELLIGPRETSRSFTPKEPWRPSRHVLRVDHELEDLAGNTPARLFDLDLQAGNSANPVLSLGFSPLKNK